jgi:hypothetical protein
MIISVVKPKLMQKEQTCLAAGKAQGARYKAQGTRKFQGRRLKARYKIEGSRKVQGTRHKEVPREKAQGRSKL